MRNRGEHQRRIVSAKESPAQTRFRRLRARKKLWEKSRGRELTLRETFDLCRQCHRFAPFCFYNGNTFAAIGRTLIQDLLRKMPPVKAHSLRSVVGHYIAGTIGEDELSKTLESLD